MESYFYKKIVKIFTIQGGNGILAMQQYFHGELQVKIFVTSQAVCHYLWKLAHGWSLKELTKTTAHLGLHGSSQGLIPELGWERKGMRARNTVGKQHSQVGWPGSRPHPTTATETMTLPPGSGFPSSAVTKPLILTGPSPSRIKTVFSSLPCRLSVVMWLCPGQSDTNEGAMSNF